jgi:hypothetical protein
MARELEEPCADPVPRPRAAVLQLLLHPGATRGGAMQTASLCREKRGSYSSPHAECAPST